MNKFQMIMVVSYLLMTSYFFLNWLRFSLRHPSYSVEDTFLSFVMLCVTTVFWPFVVPASLLEIFKTRRLQLETVAPVLAAVVAVSLSIYITKLPLT
ncbi:hypothetical protein Cal6303_0613 [Calothrix sp. PCC 6303]|nr:hypothetical protein Cal6303_0613 [Calothrix sp. PCC 6303]